MERHRVLIVDDNEATLTLVTALLRRDFAVEAVADGHSAIEKLRTQQYGAILLDLRMPQPDGFGVLDFLRTHRPDALPRVLVVTAALARSEIDRANDFGICGILSKPFEIEALLDAVRHCVGPDPVPLGNLFSSGMIFLLADILHHRLM